MLQRTGFDINKIKGSGTLILPISMSRISAGQSPEDCYEILDYFTDKLESFNNDAILMYTNGLYFNSEDLAFEKRIKTNNQAISHASRMRKIINKNRKFIPKAIHFMPIDYVILNSSEYQEMFSLLKNREKEDLKLQEFIKEDIKGREYNEANINFIFEEVVVSHLIREQFFDLPTTLARADEWRLMCYAGKTSKTEVYVHQTNLLSKNKTCVNEYRGAQYNFENKTLEVFDDIKL